jgi:hypothetical protein
MNEGAESTIEAGAAGAPEGAVNQPSTEDIQSMYDGLGIKATAPSGKPKGRPKASDVRAKNSPKDAAGNTDARDSKNDDDKGKPKDAPNPGKDGDSGNDIDEKGTKERKDTAKVSDKSEETDDSVRKAKPGSEDDSKRGSEEDPKPGDNGSGQEEDKQESSEEEGKRPGKSNPKIEQRFQRLANESREKDEVIADLQQKLQAATSAQQQTQIDQEDPEYTIDDFRKVRDENDNILDLDENQAELAFRRWKDGYDQRKTEREAKVNHERQAEEGRAAAIHALMDSSVRAYDTLTGLLDTYPQLNSEHKEFDQELSDSVMPIIQDMVIYQPGTEPDNQNGTQPVVIGLKMDPTKILDAMNKIRESKRTLPLNGVNDNVEVKSNVNVPHSRSSDPTVNAANELMKSLNINKRF